MNIMNVIREAHSNYINAIISTIAALNEEIQVASKSASCHDQLQINMNLIQKMYDSITSLNLIYSDFAKLFGEEPSHPKIQNNIKIFKGKSPREMYIPFIIKYGLLHKDKEGYSSVKKFYSYFEENLSELLTETDRSLTETGVPRWKLVCSHSFNAAKDRGWIKKITAFTYQVTEVGREEAKKMDKV